MGVLSIKLRNKLIRDNFEKSQMRQIKKTNINWENVTSVPPEIILLNADKFICTFIC